MPTRSVSIPTAHARAIWIHAQRLDTSTPFGDDVGAVQRAVEHLGYVQIDTINVIERSHHHILHSRIPAYRTQHLETAQSVGKSVFEYWAHALAYLPASDYRFFVAAMNAYNVKPPSYLAGVSEEDYGALLKRIRVDGALSIRDIGDDVLVEKTHAWGSRKPSKRALSLGFFTGDLTISKRTGMLKTYELSARHFGWKRRPLPVSERQFAAYLLTRALRSQGIVSLDSICYGNAAAKARVGELIASGVSRKRLVPVTLAGHAGKPHWVEPAVLEGGAELPHEPTVHILSPFDPLIIQRKRLQLFFDYEHRFEAYLPAEKRVLGYFALPVLVGNEIVAALDLKMDRQAGKLLVKQWTWMVKKRSGMKAVVDEALHLFERFQKG